MSKKHCKPIVNKDEYDCKLTSIKKDVMTEKEAREFIKRMSWLKFKNWMNHQTVPKKGYYSYDVIRFTDIFLFRGKEIWD